LILFAEDAEILVLRQLRTRITPEEINEKVEEEVKDKRLARKLGIYFSRKCTNQKLKEIADIFGGIGDTGVSRIYRRVKEAIKKEKRLERLIKRLENGIMWNVKTRPLGLSMRRRNSLVLS